MNRFLKSYRSGYVIGKDIILKRRSHHSRYDFCIKNNYSFKKIMFVSMFFFFFFITKVMFGMTILTQYISFFKRHDFYQNKTKNIFY